MTARRGLTKDDVIDVAVSLVESESAASLSLSRVARELGVKPPSLYNHVSGLDALHRDVGLRAMKAMGAQLGKAAMGRSGSEALLAIAEGFRSYATDHPHLYELSIQARPEDDEYAAVALEATEPVIAVLRGYDLDETAAIHAARMLRSALHGFVSLEVAGGFGFDIDIDDSFTWLVERLADALEAPSRAS